MKPVFSKSRIIRIPQTASTNKYLLQLSKQQTLTEGTALVTDQQTHGRGHGNSSWESEPGANLTFSILLYPSFIHASQQFILSKAISLAVYDFLSPLVADVAVKWPNDVYVAEQKIAGILIENFMIDDDLTKSIAGIGLNINQIHFLSDAPNPVSLRQLTGKIYLLENSLQTLHTCIANRYRMIIENEEKLNSDYLQHLYRYGKMSRYSASGIFFNATITGINQYGMLEMTTNYGDHKTFGFKEVEFL